MKKNVIVLGLIFLVIVSSFSAFALERKTYYKGEDNLLLREGDRLIFEDLKLRVRDVDHYEKTAKFDFTIGKKRLDRVELGLYESYTFQNKLKIKVVDVYRKLWYKNERVYFVRVEITPVSSGRIAAIDLSEKFGKNPYVLIENTGIQQEEYSIEVSTLTKTFEVNPERMNVAISPFGSEKITLRVEEKPHLYPLNDLVIIKLFKDDKLIDAGVSRI